LIFSAFNDLAVESVLEDLSLKQDIFAKLDEICPPSVILCTDTSGLRVTDIASKAKHQERILATHYTQPPHFAPMVEVVPGEKTDPVLVPFVAGMLRKMRKMVIVIPRDSPRFIQNRIQGAIAQECQKLVDEGLGTPEIIDEVFTSGPKKRKINSWNGTTPNLSGS
jgi:3-hydroxybutyryl-CoA dehydrogenase